MNTTTTEAEETAPTFKLIDFVHFERGPAEGSALHFFDGVTPDFFHRLAEVIMGAGEIINERQAEKTNISQEEHILFMRDQIDANMGPFTFHQLLLVTYIIANSIGFNQGRWAMEIEYETAIAERIKQLTQDDAATAQVNTSGFGTKGGVA